MSRRYPAAFHDFMREYVPGHKARQIAAEAKIRLGIEVTAEQVKSYCQNHKLRMGTKKGVPRGLPSALFPAPVSEYIKTHYVGVGPTQMTGDLNRRFGKNYKTKQLKAYYKNHNLNSGLTGKFEKGHEPANKGRKGWCPPGCEVTQFKPGNVPQNKHPVGTVLERPDGYLWRKIGEGAREWKQEHILRWEEKNVPIPDGYRLTFLDGDRHNIDLSNLKLIDNDVNLELNRRHLRTSSAELNKTAILTATLSVAAYRAKKANAPASKKPTL